MSTGVSASASVCASAALTACLIGPAAAYTVYDGPIDPPPQDCGINLYLTDIIDARPRPRPVFQPSLGPRAVAQQLPGAFPISRQVAYTLNFSRLNMQIPQVSGVFSVSQVRAIVYAGPTRSYPVVADQTRADWTASIAWSATATEGRSIRTSYQNKWLVAVQSTGKRKSDEFNPWLPASVTLDCMMTVKPPAPAVNAK